MSLTTLTPMPGGFDDFDRLAFDLIVDGFDLETQPSGEPLPEPEQARRIVRQRLARGNEKRTAIYSELGLRRHRTHEREA